MATNTLSFKEKCGYGLGDTASNLFFQTVNIFLLYYYTDVFGIPAAAVGTLFIVSRFWDALNDPIMGLIADRTTSRWGKYRPYLLFGALPFGIIGYLTFANPDLGDQGKLIYAYVTYIFLMMAYTVVNVPYSALMGVMTPHSEERTVLSSYRFIGAFTGGLLVSLFIRPLVRLLGGGDEALGFKLTMALFSTLAVVMFLLTFAWTRERVPPLIEQSSDVKGDIGVMLKNVPWLVMVVAAVLTLSNVAIRGSVTNHFFKYYVGDTGEAYFGFLDKTSLLLTTGSIAFIVGICFTTWIGKRFGKRNALIGLTLLNALSLLVFYFLPADAYGPMLAINALGSLLAGPTPALVWSIYTDVADYGEWKFGRRTTALCFSAAMFAQKMGLTIGGGVAGWLLSGYGFEANAQQTPETLDGIRFMFSILPGLLGVANAFVLLAYPLTDKKVAEIEAELKTRRQPS